MQTVKTSDDWLQSEAADPVRRDGYENAMALARCSGPQQRLDWLQRTRALNVTSMRVVDAMIAEELKAIEDAR